MYTTLSEILKHNPCNQKGGTKDGGWQLLLHNLGKTKPDNQKLSFKRILKSNGIMDAVWALRCLDYEDKCLFMADVAESVLHIFEKKYPDDRPRKAIEAVRDYKSKSITKDQLGEARLAAMAAADAADAAYAYAAYAYAAYAAYAAAAAADADAVDAYAYAYAANANAAAGKNKWVEIETIFVKYFC